MNKLKALAVLVAVSAAAVSFNAFAANAYKVKAQISQDGKIVASPAVLVKAGSPGVIKMNGVGGNDLVLNASYVGSGKIKVTSTISSKAGTSQPTVIVGPSSPATVKASGVELAFTATQSNS